MMGTSVEFFFQPPGNGPLKADYLIGEDVVDAAAACARMANPGGFGEPDHYSRRLHRRCADNGGVHINSRHPEPRLLPRDRRRHQPDVGPRVQGVGAANREQIEKVFYRAFRAHAVERDFLRGAAVTLQAAQDLYGWQRTVQRRARRLDRRGGELCGPSCGPPSSRSGADVPGRRAARRRKRPRRTLRFRISVMPAFQPTRRTPSTSTTTALCVPWRTRAIISRTRWAAGRCSTAARSTSLPAALASASPRRGFEGEATRRSMPPSRIRSFSVRLGCLGPASGLRREELATHLQLSISFGRWNRSTLRCRPVRRSSGSTSVSSTTSSFRRYLSI